MPTTTRNKLSSRHRVNRMFARQDHDRVPRHESFWNETIERFEREGLVGGREAVLRLLESDLRSLNWLWPQCFPGDRVVVSEDEETRTIRDSNGRIARFWKNKSGTPEHIGFECDSREKWDQVYKPALLKNWMQVDTAEIAKKYAEARSEDMWTHLTGVESFEETRQLIGDEVVLMAMAEDPDWVIDISRTFTDVLLRNLDVVMDTGIEPDGLWIYGDMAFKTSTMCSPAMYRELIWPDHKHIADWAHAHGMKLIFHTDGDVNRVIDMYIEAGFDCLQPLEAKANMDIRNLCPKWGDKLAFFGNVDVMKLATNDLELIEEEVRVKIEAGKKARGYIYHSDHSVPPQVTWKTYQAIIGFVEKYGYYE